jgi:hypothetical protein
MVRLFLAFLFVPSALFAQVQMPRDEKVEAIAGDLRTMARVVEVAKDLRDNRQVLLSIVDQDVELLRMKRDDGTYRWASLQREEGGRVAEEKTVDKVQSEKELRNVSVSTLNAYRVVVTVPRKRGLVTANNRVWIRNVVVDSTGFDGKVSHQELPVNVWVNPGDNYGLALPEIGKSVRVTAELGVESGNKEAVANVALLEAKLVDDPTGPYFPAVSRLLQIRRVVTANDIQRGVLKTALDEALLSVPGELEKRAAEQAQLSQARKDLAVSGIAKGTISLGDATPDVVKELAEIQRLLAGTLDEQSEARKRLHALSAALAPPVAQQ